MAAAVAAIQVRGSPRPKFGNCSSTFVVITYDVTSQPSAPAGGFATAHQNAPGIRCRASTSACNTPHRCRSRHL
jgi:hypothetical protein